MSLQSAAIHISLTVVAAWVNAFGVISSAIAGYVPLIIGGIYFLSGRWKR